MRISIDFPFDVELPREERVNRMAEKIRKAGFEPVVKYPDLITDNVPFYPTIKDDIVLFYLFPGHAELLHYSIPCPIILVRPKEKRGNDNQLRIVGALDESCSVEELKAAIEQASKMTR